MRTGMNKLWGSRRTPWAVLAASLLMASLLVVGAQPSSATVTQEVMATCRGADDFSIGIVNNPAINLGKPMPLSVTTEAPAFVEPGQTGVPVSITWGLSLSQTLVDAAIGLDVKTIDVKGAKVDTTVTGPTSTKLIPGSPPNQSVTLVAGQPFNASFGPFTGTLDDIGNSGIIKLRSESVTFTVFVSKLAQDINLICDTGATFATVPVKVAGSPDIPPDIKADGPEGQPVTIDVLKSVKNGTDRSGQVREVDPKSLKVIEGPGSVQGGKLVVTAPAAGSTVDTTFEVCAGSVETQPATEGTDEVQRIRLFHEPDNGWKRSFAATFKLGGDAGQPVWMLPALLGGTGPIPQPWQDYALSYAIGGIVVPFEWPSAAAMQVAIQSIPDVGAGNVTVTRGEVKKLEGANAYWYADYDIAFSGALGKRDVPTLGTGYFASFLPQEVLMTLLKVLDKPKDEGGGGGGGGVPKTPIPAGMTAQQYLISIGEGISVLIANPLLWGEVPAQVDLYFKVLGENIMDFIDIPAALNFINGLFTRTPEMGTPVKGAEPTAAQFTELCSQGVATVLGTGVGGVTSTTSGDGDGNGGGAKQSMTG